MKILITGSKGFIGGYISHNIYSKSIGIDIFDNSDKEKNYFKADIADISQLTAFLKKNQDIDVIIHAAALAHNKGTDLSFEKFKKINYEGTKNLVDLSNKYLKLKRFIFCSTISVYGEELKKSIYTEADNVNPKTPYAVTKRMAEEYIVNNAKFNYTILRFSPVYSSEFTLNIDRRTKIRNMIYKVGNAQNRLSLLHVKNIVLLIDYLLKNKNKCINDIYNVADSTIYRFSDLVEIQMARSEHEKMIPFPTFLFRLIYILGKLVKNNFLLENSVKLISDNIYDTSKISAHIILKYNINEAFK